MTMVSKLSQIGQILFKDINHYPKSEEEAYLRMAKSILKQRDFRLRISDVAWFGLFMWALSTALFTLPIIFHGLFPDSIADPEFSAMDLFVAPLSMTLVVIIMIPLIEYAHTVCAKQPEFDWAEKYRDELKKN